MQPPSTLILAATARNDGNTIYAVERLRSKLTSANFIDITALKLNGFDYHSSCEVDGFLTVIETIIAHKTIIFATPVYWYAMSGPMKTFFDRLSDLLVQPALRPTGRALARRDVWLLTTGTDPELPAGFTEPFIRTSSYFEMRWRDSCYVRAIDENRPQEAELQKIDDFAKAILEPPPTATP
jgi:putative NADPH-quinone reductase